MHNLLLICLFVALWNTSLQPWSFGIDEDTSENNLRFFRHDRALVTKGRHIHLFGHNSHQLKSIFLVRLCTNVIESRSYFPSAVDQWLIRNSSSIPPLWVILSFCPFLSIYVPACAKHSCSVFGKRDLGRGATSMLIIISLSDPKKVMETLGQYVEVVVTDQGLINCESW